MEIKITKEKILEAASKCSTAKQTLIILFPEVFKEINEFEENKIYGYEGRSGSKYKLQRALNDSFSWAATNSSVAHANGSHDTAETCLEYAKQNGRLRVFESIDDFAKWLLE